MQKKSKESQSKLTTTNKSIWQGYRIKVNVQLSI